MLLDLSAAFDTVDHHILITRLKHRFGITGKALGWIQPYLSGRTQFVKIGTERSSNRNLLCGVPQGSVLGPILYSMYTSPLTDIMSKHNMNHHFYADDNQIYLSFKTSAAGEPTTANCALSHAFTMLTIGCHPINLMVNHDKTELLVLLARYRAQLPIESIHVCSDVIYSSNSAKNISAWFDTVYGQTNKQRMPVCFLPPAQHCSNQ